MSLQLLQQRGVFVQPHEGLTETGGQGQDPRSTGSLALHELVELLAVKTHTNNNTQLNTQCVIFSIQRKTKDGSSRGSWELLSSMLCVAT